MYYIKLQVIENYKIIGIKVSKIIETKNLFYDDSKLYL